MKKILVLSFMLFIILTPNVFAANSNPIIKSYSFEENATLTGVNTNYSKFFYINDTWNVKSVSLNIFLSQSNLLDKALSNLTVCVNSIPYKTFKFSHIGTSGEISLVIPGDMVKSGYNEITIKGTRHLSEKPCADDYNVGNYYVIYKNSHIDVSFTDKKTENTLSFFPYPYYKHYDKTPVNIVLGKEKGVYEDKAAIMLSSYFGTLSKEDIRINSTTFNNFKLSDDCIYIGEYKDLPVNIKSYVTNSELVLLEKKALIKQIEYKDKKALLIIGSGENLINAIRYLSNNELVKNTYEKSIVIDKNTSTKDIKAKESDTYTFKDLGYKGMLFEGPFKHEAVYVKTIPKDLVIENGKIVIKFRYSKNLDFEKSLLTVNINGIPIGSKKLEKLKGDNDIFEISIPKEIRESVINIGVRFDLEVQDVYCDFSNKQTPFAYILEDSYISLTKENIKEATLETYPAPFIANYEINDLAFVVDDNNLDRLNFCCNIASLMGKSIKYNTGNVEYITTGEIEKYKSKNLIIIGTSKDKLIKSLSNKLHIKYNKKFNSFISNEKIQIGENLGKNSGTIQIIDSPYKLNNNIMVITGSDNYLIGYAKPYLTNSLMVGKLSGNASIIDSKGKVINNNFNINNTENKKHYRINYNKGIIVAYLVMVTIILITSSIFIIRNIRP